MISLQYFSELNMNIILGKKVLDSISVAFSDILKAKVVFTFMSITTYLKLIQTLCYYDMDAGVQRLMA